MRLYLHISWKTCISDIKKPPEECEHSTPGASPCLTGLDQPLPAEQAPMICWRELGIGEECEASNCSSYFPTICWGLTNTHHATSRTGRDLCASGVSLMSSPHPLGSRCEGFTPEQQAHSSVSFLYILKGISPAGAFSKGDWPSPDEKYYRRSNDGVAMWHLSNTLRWRPT